MKNGNDTATSQVKKERKLEYWLVIWMLIFLTILMTLLILLPAIVSKEGLVDYSKWVLTALLAAFGAWIGAGAAYFFGKENLKVSSESTQKALETQHKLARTNLDQALIKDINLTPMNPDFRFTIDETVDKVTDKLDKNVDYWFVPVLDKDGKMEDVVHTEALWRFYKDDKNAGTKKISDVINYIESNDKTKVKAGKLHGFFEEVDMDAQVLNVSALMKRNDTSVGIVVDENGKPTHCFSRKDLRSFLLGSS